MRCLSLHRVNRTVAAGLAGAGLRLAACLAAGLAADLAAGLAVGLALGLAAGLTGCSSEPGRAAAASDEASPAVQPAACAGTPVGIDAVHSQLDVLVFRGGAAARLGHNHVAQPQDLTGWACLPPGAGGGSVAGTQFAIAFRLDAMRLDDPAARAALGPGWASVPDARDIAGTRAHMLESLDAAQFPWVRVRSVAVQGQAPALAAELEIELHGRVRRERVALDVQPTELSATTVWVARGALVLRQSDWGIAPYSVLGGLLAVRDELVLHFAIQTSPANVSTSTVFSVSSVTSGP